uniref:Ribosomal protein S18 n=1 Tax=Hildenbrandia rivularis TaxID=135206 RepID=A0A1C9CFF7_9FLOR|nr:ribosomal protein S18 [Hildenbrandia rivularis]AOM67094.1 ribosomal protein S18 [Hildenbrandia rivularis]
MNNLSISSKILLTYKDIDLLRTFINDQGKILPRRLTGLNSKQQKRLTKAVKQARTLALLPFIKNN